VVDTVEETAPGASSSLRYDAATDTYVYVWKTEKAWADSCRRPSPTLTDGTAHEARFSFVK
jgi:hypothetical protein